MSTSYETENIPTCLLVNPDQIGASELHQALLKQGIEVTTISETDINSDKSNNITYIVWFFKSVSIPAETIESFVSLQRATLSKMLLVAPLDVHSSQKEIKDRCINLKNKLGTHSNLDIRCIFHEGVWSLASNQTRTLTSYIVQHVRQGTLPNLQMLTLYPASATAAAVSMLRLWFDRGHRNQTMLVRGQALAGQTAESQLTTKTPQLTIVPIEAGWGSEISIDGEVIEVVSKKSSQEVIDYLSEQVNILPQLPINPPVTPTPSGSTPERNRIQFRAEVVEEPVVPPAPIVPPPTPTIKEVKKIVLPEPPRPAVVPAMPQKHRNPLRFIIPGISIVIVLILIPASLVALSLFQANHASSKLERGELEQRAKHLALVESGMKQTHLYPALETIITQAKIQLLKTTANKAMVQAVKYMITATEGDPYVVFQSARHTLDDLYLLQSTHGTSADRQWTIQARRAIDLIPELIPADKKITAMILLQNNLELRPTGGFIGSVALLTFDHGKLLSYETRDIYDLDSNLKGVVNPPTELRTYLGESNWYFRDANWYPDFLDTATTANWFLEKEWGSRADVVIGINLNALKTITAALKSITLPDGQVVGPDNLLATAFNYQDAPTGSPDTKKQEFLSLFIKPLLDQITVADSNTTLALISALGQSANQGEITLIANDPVTVASLVEAGWSGKLPTLYCQPNQPEPCSADFLSVNEANVGINKTNFYLKRSIDHTINLSATEVVHQHTITYTNSSPNDTWPAGSYKAYLRTSVPPQATNVMISVNGNQLKPADYVSVTVSSYQQMGFFVEIKPQETAALVIKYQLPLSPNYRSYAFTLQKQPGVSADPIKLTLYQAGGKAFQRLNSNLGQGSGSSIEGVFDHTILTTIEMAQ